MATLVKVDKNGSKYYEGLVTCDRCGGDGIYKWGAVINGRPQYIGTCFKCEGRGKVIDKWIERTPEYQAKLDARRAKRQQAQMAEQERIRKEQEAEIARIEAERAKEQARKAISQYVGEEGQRLTMDVVLEHIGSFERSAYRGWGTETVTVYTFDANGNKLVWFTTGMGLDEKEGDSLQIAFTVKGYKEYNGEKQTTITRVKVKEVYPPVATEEEEESSSNDEEVVSESADADAKMSAFQFQWWTVEVREATGKMGWEVKAKTKENAIKAIKKRAKEHDEFVQKHRPDFQTEIYWDTLTLDRDGYQRMRCG